VVLPEAVELVEAVEMDGDDEDVVVVAEPFSLYMFCILGHPRYSCRLPPHPFEQPVSASVTSRTIVALVVMANTSFAVVWTLCCECGLWVEG
jgi:hypothetical protein